MGSQASMRNSHHGVRASVETHRAPEDVGIAAKAPVPQLVAQDHQSLRGTHGRLLGGKASTQRKIETHQLEVLATDQLDQKPLPPGAVFELGTAETMEKRTVDRMGSPDHVEIIGIRGIAVELPIPFAGEDGDRLTAHRCRRRAQ
jgi:hypothetical protein